MNIRKLFLIIQFWILVLCSIGAFSQGNVKTEELYWTPIVKFHYTEYESSSVLAFKGSKYDAEYGYLPLWIIKEPITTSNVSPEILESKYYPLSKDEALVLENNKKKNLIKEDVYFTIKTGVEQKKYFQIISLIPIRKNKVSGNYEKLISFSYRLVETTPRIISRTTTFRYSNNSILSSGDWYKIGVTQNGIYKIDSDFIKSLGINPTDINPKDIRLFGNGGGMLPLINSEDKKDDLTENAIYVYGEDDGRFDNTDYVLFYGMSPVVWRYDNSSNKFSHKMNLYSDTTYYFLSFNSGAGKRVSQNYSEDVPASHIVNSFDDYSFHELDKINLLRSGREWYGEKFDIIDNYNFSFSFSNIDIGNPVTVKVDAIARSSSNTSFSISSGNTAFNMQHSGVSVSSYYGLYANAKSGEYTFLPSGNVFNLNLKYNKASSSDIGYLNYIEVFARRLLRMTGSQMFFRDTKSVGPGNVSEFQIQGATLNLKIWDVTDPMNCKEIAGSLSGNTYFLKTKTDSLHEFVSFTNQNYHAPAYSGIVINQNLHSFSSVDYIIVTHKKFINQANELASLHREDGLKVEVVTNEQVYNEFSSGAKDIAAIRNLMKMLYDKAANIQDLPKYLLLIGDGSYDNKGNSSANTNYILTYQSVNSLSPTQSYVSDDFFGLLDDDEGLVGDNELLDIGIGRFPVRTEQEAKDFLRKIENYRSPLTMKNWRNYLGFVADDKDGSEHLKQADALANNVNNNNRDYNLDKIYFDAYPLESTPGGQRYPGVNLDISKRFEKGALILNYTGHGGEAGWAHERVLSVSDINALKNFNNLPLLFTATCEFSRFDDPARTSAGEYVFLNPEGGGIGLFTTVRVVYSNPNFTLNEKFYNHVFAKIDGEMPRMGDVFRSVKVESKGGVNDRNFTFLGDPALKLAYPKYQVVTTSVNGKAIAEIDTIKALEKVVITGSVKDKNGNKLSGYNGVLYPTVFDKSVITQTLGNDPSSPIKQFLQQKSIIYKGKVSVVDGEFSFTFIVPKDISYSYGLGKISYYVENGFEDGQGYFEGFVIGGASDSIVADNVSPSLKLYMNNDKFISGGITNESPVILVFAEDENGINTVGNGIGHDLTAVLDGNTDKTIVLNDFYESEMDSYQKGVIRYPLKGLSEGGHNLKVKVWDVYNNSAEAYLEFVVANSEEIALKHVFNYPNPFTSNTQFMFEHNQSNTSLNVQIQIFTLSGKIVKTINVLVNSDGFRPDSIQWNGLDDYNDKIGKGVYVYKLQVSTPDGKHAEKFEKLVILN